MSKKTNRTLGWTSADGQIFRVCDLQDHHLLTCITLSRRRIMGTKLTTGVTSLSFLAYQYLVEEAKERGIYPDDIDNSSFEP